jgi:RNA polymerase sigma factor FliA
MSERTPGLDASPPTLAPEAAQAGGGRVPTQPGEAAADEAARQAAIEALWRRYKAASGDGRLRERLILHYSPLVKHVAGRVSTGLPSNVDAGDCMSYGIFGLIDAIEKFDPERGAKFEPYAMRRIRGAILDELRALDWIPRSVRAKARAVERAYAELEARLHRRPTEAEIAAELGIALAELHQIFGQVSVANVLALDELLTVADDSPGAISLGETLEDLAADDPVAVFESRETRGLLAGAVADLPERERAVVELYYFHGRTLADIGRELGVSESRVCQIHTKVMVALREKLAEPHI